MISRTASRSFPKVVACVLNWNQKDLTVDCVRSLLGSDYGNLEIMVIDNGSTDGSAGTLRSMFGDRIGVVENRANLGYSRGFNAGLKKAFIERQADYCLVMNNDTTIDPGAVSELVTVAVTDPAIGFVTGKVYFHDRPDTLQTVGKMADPVRWNGEHIGYGEVDRGQYDEIAERIFTDDIYTLVSRRLYLDTGGYDPVFFLQGEEYDWQARAKEKGYRIMYAPRARLWHRVSVTLGRSSPKKAFFDARNPMIVVLLHKPPGFFRRYFWHHMKRDIIRTSLVMVKHRQFMSAFRTWLGLLSGIRWGIQNKHLRLSHFLPVDDHD